MEKARKNIKVTAICIIALALLKLVASIVNFVTKGVEIPESMITPELTRDALHAIMVVVWVVTLILHLPSFYVGFKGLKVAKNPDNSKAHIVWATILLVFAVISVLSQVGELSKATDMLDAILKIVDEVCIGVLYIFYILEAKKIRAGE